jgi:hypothetical protein
MFILPAKVGKFPVYLYQKNEKKSKEFTVLFPKIIYYFKKEKKVYLL